MMLRLWVAVVAVVGLAAAVLARCSSGIGDASNASTTSRQPPAAAGGSAADAPLAIDVEAARAEAVRVVASTGDVVDAGFISRLELVESLATPQFGPTLATQTSEQVTRMLAGLGNRGIDGATVNVLEVPVTASATPVHRGVRVEVWSVVIINAPGAGVGRQAWRTVVVDMQWVNGGWLVDSWSSTPGPTPGLPPEGVLSTPEEVAAPLGWEPVVAGAA